MSQTTQSAILPSKALQWGSPTHRQVSQHGVSCAVRFWVKLKSSLTLGSITNRGVPNKGRHSPLVHDISEAAGQHEGMLAPGQDAVPRKSTGGQRLQGTRGSVAMVAVNSHSRDDTSKITIIMINLRCRSKRYEIESLWRRDFRNLDFFSPRKYFGYFTKKGKMWY